MPQWTLFENDFRTIDIVLSELLERTNALSVHLVDRSGQLITSAGRTGDFDASSFANAEISQLLGESGVEAVVAEGTQRSVYSVMLAGRVILCSVFDRRSTLGIVRFRAQRAVADLEPVFLGLFEKVGLAETTRATGTFATDDYAVAAAREVDALFGD
jgi:predicted regulator of Ras-like GTPase activity (Roadblock/LC7/MglB family)